MCDGNCDTNTCCNCGLLEDKQFVDSYDWLSRKNYRPWGAWYESAKENPTKRIAHTCSCGSELKSSGHGIGNAIWYCPVCD